MSFELGIVVGAVAVVLIGGICFYFATREAAQSLERGIGIDP